MMIRFAILSFPGSTGERGAVSAFVRNGMEAEVVRWNEMDRLESEDFDGYFLSGGRSFGGAGRGGVVASREPIMEMVRREAEKGRVVLGVGDGAQILVESGLVPGCEGDALACGLAPNAPEGRFSGGWALVKDASPRGRSAFGDSGGLLRLPMACSEGRFVFASPETLKRIKKNGQVLYEYADVQGGVAKMFPENPTGSEGAVAALCNPSGNVMAMVPQPERDARGSGDHVFRSMRAWIERRGKAEYPPLGSCGLKEDIRPFSPSGMEILISPGFQDEEEKIVMRLLARLGFKVRLRRFRYLAIDRGPGLMREKAIEGLLEAGLLSKMKGERAMVRIEGETYEVKPEEGLRKIEAHAERWVVVMPKGDVGAGAEKEMVSHHLGNGVRGLRRGVVWEIEGADEERRYAIIRTKILYNPAFQYVMMA